MTDPAKQVFHRVYVRGIRIDILPYNNPPLTVGSFIRIS
jgi:hypothetical protein